VSSLQPNLFRAGTDNDGVKQLGDQFFDKSKPLGLWLTLGLDCTTLEDLDVTLSSKKINFSGDAMDFPSFVTKARIFGHPGRRKYEGITLAEKLEDSSTSSVKLGKWEQQVTMVGNGSVHVEITLDLEESLRDLPRVGLQFTSPCMGKACFFANGPHENYSDRRYSAHAGVYEVDTPSSLDTYVVPQEQGNRTGLRWLFLYQSSSSDNAGRSKEATEVEEDSIANLVANKTGILILPEDLVEFTTSRFTDAEVFAARHVNDLIPPNNDEYYVRLDVAQRGLGTGSCGPQTLEKYTIHGGTYRIAFWLKPVGYD